MIHPYKGGHSNMDGPRRPYTKGETGYKGTHTVCFHLLETSIVTKYINIEGGCQDQVHGVGRFEDHYSTAPKSFTAPSEV